MSAPPTSTAALGSSSEPALDFSDVWLGFEEGPILRGLSFSVQPRETLILLGETGTGKTLTLKLAAGLLCPDSGTVRALGQDITGKPERELLEFRRQVGFVFQEGALFDSLTVRENVAFRLLEEGNVTEEEVEPVVREALSFVELENTVDMYPSELSGGMRRRVDIARAIITRPELLVYDSPTGGLDPVTSTTIIELIIKQRDVFKTSSLLVTHRLQDAFMMATHYFDRKSNRMQPLPPGMQGEVPMGFLILRDGKIIFDGNLDELVHTQDEYIREYIS